MHVECIGRKSAMIDATTPKVLDFSYRTLADNIMCQKNYILDLLQHVIKVIC